MAATAPDLTLAGQVVGTPAYMAPEQLDGSMVDVRADLFAAGVLLFEMVAGRSPFAAATTMASMHAVLYERPPALTGSAAVEALDRVVRRALEKKPADRYQTAANMAAAVSVADGADDSADWCARSPSPGSSSCRSGSCRPTPTPTSWLSAWPTR